MKALLKIIVGLIVVVVITVVAVLTLVNPNDYKQEIQDAVKQNTGRDLAIEGEMKLSFFPWVGLELNEIALSNAQGFEAKNMASIGKMDVRLKIIPLLSKEIHIAKVVLHGLTVNLKINKKGVSNWDDLAQPETMPEKEGSASKEVKEDLAKEVADKQGFEVPKLVLGGIEFTDANISYADLTSGTVNNLQNFNLVIGHFELGKAFDMKMDFAVTNKEPAVTADISFGGKYTINLVDQHYQISNMFLKVEAKGDVVPGGSQKIALDANADINLKKDIVDLQNMTLHLANVVLNGQATIKQATKEPQVLGKLSIDKFSLRNTMAMLKMTLPEMADGTTLTEISAKLNLDANLNQATINNLDLQLDQTHLTGKLSVTDFAKPAVRYDLVLSEIDVDRYLPPKKEQLEVLEKEVKTSTEPAKDIPIELPVEMIKGLDVKGHFTAKGFKVMNLKTQQTDIGLLAKNGIININPLKTNLYEGAMDAKIVLDVNTKKPTYKFKTELDGVEVEPLMTDFMELDKIQGKTLANINVTTTGASVNQLKAALNGKLNLAFKNGAVKGFNLSREIRKADAAINGKKFDDSIADPKTDFSDVTMSAIITNGILKNNDFSLKAPLLRVGGEGEVDLVKSTIDYLVRAVVTSKQQGQSGDDVSKVAGMSIPVKISGPFSDLDIDVQLGAALAAKAKAELKAAADAKKKELKAAVDVKKQELQQAKQKAEAEAKAKMKAKSDAEKQKAKEKLKNKFKKLF